MVSNCKKYNHSGAKITQQCETLDRSFQVDFAKLQFVNSNTNLGKQHYIYDVNKQDPNEWTKHFQDFTYDMKFLDDLEDLQEFDTFFGGVMQDVTKEKIDKFITSTNADMHLGHTKRDDKPHEPTTATSMIFFGQQGYFRQLKYVKYDCNRYYNPLVYSYNRFRAYFAHKNKVHIQQTCAQKLCMNRNQLDVIKEIHMAHVVEVVLVL